MGILKYWEPLKIQKAPKEDLLKISINPKSQLRILFPMWNRNANMKEFLIPELLKLDETWFY